MKRSRIPVTAISAVAVLGTTGCGAGVAGSSSSTAAAPAPSLFAYQPFATTYEIRTHTLQEQEFGGQVNTVDIGVRWLVTAAAEASTTPWLLTIRVDSTPEVTGSAPGLSDADVASAVGAIFTGTLSPQGEVADFQAGDSASTFLQQQARAFQRFFPRVPVGGLAPGQTWTDTAEVNTESGGLDIQVETVTESRAGAWIEHRGMQALEVKSISNYTLLGAGSQGGTEIDLDGSGTSYQTAYLGADGQFLGRVAVDTANMTATVAAMGAMIPILQITVDTVTVVR